MRLSWSHRQQRIVFVCLANICRSPLAEALLLDALQQAGLDRSVSVDSAAIESWRLGEPLHPKLVARLKADHIAIPHHKSRLLTAADGRRASTIIAMDSTTAQAARLRVGPENASKVRHFYSFQGLNRDVLDPMQTRDFDRAYDEIKAGIPAIVAQLQRDLARSE